MSSAPYFHSASGCVQKLFSCCALQGENKKQWDDPKQLQLLLQAVRQRTADWQQQYQQRQQQQPAPRLGSLLQGFFQMWSGPLSNWALGKSR